MGYGGHQGGAALRHVGQIWANQFVILFVHLIAALAAGRRQA
jgi:hypothetical protein